MFCITLGAFTFLLETSNCIPCIKNLLDGFFAVFDNFGSKTNIVLLKVLPSLFLYLKDIISQRLTDSPSCIVADSNDPSAQMQKLFKQMGQMNMPDAKPILEINPNHKIVKKMNKMSKTKQFNDSVFLVYEQALLAENIKLDNPNEFINRMNRALEKAL